MLVARCQPPMPGIVVGGRKDMLHLGKINHHVHADRKGEKISLPAPANFSRLTSP